jgi:hypothetical protein
MSRVTLRVWKRAHLEHPAFEGRPTAAARGGVDAGQKLEAPDRLNQEIVGARRQCRYDISFLVTSCDEDDGHA